MCLLPSQNMQGRHASAGGHIRIGVKLLNETINDQGKGILQHQALGSTRSADSYAPIEDLAQIFTGLDRQVTCVSSHCSLKCLLAKLSELDVIFRRQV